MATFAFTTPTIHAHDLDLTSYLKQVTLKAEVAELDVTTFGSTYRTRIGGLKTASMTGQGFWDSTPDSSSFAALGVADRVVTVCPQGAETNVAYILQAGGFSYEQFGTIGDATPFMLSSASTNAQGLVRGGMAKAKGNVSGTGQLGSILTLSAPTATQYIYASFHIFTAGTTITIQVQSDDNAPFASATTRATIGPLTTTGGTWMTRVIGPFALETFWRFNVSAITGTFNVAGAIGIQ